MSETSNETPRFKLENHISAVDAFLPNPDQQAQLYKDSLLSTNKDGVLSPVSWPAVCFALQIFTHQATLYEFLQPHARALNKTIWTAHYFHADELGLLDTPEQAEKWAMLNLPKRSSR